MVKFGAADHNGTAFAPKECLYQKVAMAMQSLKMQSLCRCNKRTDRNRPENYPDSCTAVFAENGYLGKFGNADHNGTAFAPKQCLYQKVAMAMQSLKM